MSESPATPAAAKREDRLDFGEVLIRTTRLEPEQLERARQRQVESGERLADVLIEEGMLNPSEVQKAFAEQLGLELLADLSSEDVDEKLVQQIPISFAKQHLLMPLAHDDSGAIRVAVANPLDTAPLDDLRLLFGGCEIRPELASEAAIVNLINRVYDRGSDATDQIAEEAHDDLDSFATNLGSEDVKDLLESTDDAPIIRLVNSMMQQAVKERASDIHIEPFEREIRVRFRIDDVLYEPIKPLPRALQASIASRIKIMGGLDIAEKRLPQDGRIRLKIAGRDYDVRLSTVPVAFGERPLITTVMYCNHD